MAGGIREFLDKPAGKALAGIAVVALLGLCAYSLKSSLSSDETISYSQDPWFIDSSTGQAYHHALQVGERFPVAAPSGNNSGYPAELCYWTKDGKIKKDPTPVLLNDWTGKSGPTFCPDCGRLVVGHNPPPDPNRTPPPTKEEYTKKGIALNAQQAGN